MLVGADTWRCADGTIAYYNVPWWYCVDFYTCPNSTWTLTSDHMHCTRSITTCSATPSASSEIQLIAAIVYGEASVNGSFEEKAAIACEPHSFDANSEIML